MTLTRKDLGATVLTILAVLAFAAVHEGWNVWLIGGSVRWATGAVLLLGAFTCGLGAPDRSSATSISALLGVAALVLAAIAFWTASLTALSLLVAADVLLWAISTLRHVRRHAPHAPLPT